ncbi:hypothetical protein EE612_043674 [Oryza sativa]|nr:hypothetical protein EE612_043674 [Oryza sativa]
MQASVAVSEALEAGKLSAAPRDGAADFAVAWLAVVVVSLAVAATCVVVSFDAHARQPGRLRRMLDLGPSVRGARLLLAIFAGLLAAAEVIRLPFFSRAVVSPPRHVVPCLAYPLVAHGVAEPCFLATVLLLLRASTGGARLPAAALAVPFACLPFLSAHVAVLVLRRPSRRTRPARARRGRRRALRLPGVRRRAARRARRALRAAAPVRVLDRRRRRHQPADAREGVRARRARRRAAPRAGGGARALLRVGDAAAHVAGGRLPRVPRRRDSRGGRAGDPRAAAGVRRALPWRRRAAAGGGGGRRRGSARARQMTKGDCALKLTCLKAKGLARKKTTCFACIIFVVVL